MKNSVSYPRSKVVDVLRSLDEIVVSLDRIGSHANDVTREKYLATFEAFIRQHNVFAKLARARAILSEPFSTSLGADDMDELERAMQGVRYWTAHKTTAKRKNKR